MAEQTVSLAPGESTVVSFQAVPGEARVYQVTVDGLTGSFMAIEKEEEKIFYTCPIDGAQFDTLEEMEAYTAETYPPTTPLEEMPPSVQAENPSPAEQSWVSYVMETVPEASTDYFWTGQF